MGAAARVRRFYVDLVAGEEQLLDEEILGKIRLFESALPFLCRVLRMPGVRSFADLLPDDDAEAEHLLHLLHDWSARMLDPAGDIIEQLPSATDTPTTRPGAGGELLEPPPSIEAAS